MVGDLLKLTAYRNAAGMDSMIPEGSYAIVKVIQLQLSGRAGDVRVLYTTEEMQDISPRLVMYVTPGCDEWEPLDLTIDENAALLMRLTLEGTEL